MFKEERYDKILELLDKDIYISVHKLSKLLFVSLPTVRRDLTELEHRKLILRSHGGAKKLNSENSVIPFDFRKKTNHKEKRLICQAASKLIKSNDLIFIDASTTASYISEFISSKSLVTVITNSIFLSAALTRNGVETYCTGGELQQKSMCYAGGFAEEFLKKFNFDIMFFSCHGVNDKNIIVDTSMQETYLRNVALKQSAKTVFLCDKSKFSLTAPYNLAPLDDVDVIISDKENVNRLTDTQAIFIR